MNIVTIIKNEITENAQQPFYLNFVKALQKGLEGGLLKQGDSLPTHRQLAEELDLSIGTVSRAFKEAQKRSLTAAVTGRGTVIASPSNNIDIVTEQKTCYDLSFVSPFEYLNPPLETALNKINVSDREFLKYHKPSGMPAHRKAGALWTQKFGLSVSEKNILVCSGAQHALLSLLMGLFRAGDRIAAENITYPLLKELCRRLSLNLIPVKMDEAGIIPQSFELACKNGGIKGLYLMPSCQNPTLCQIPEYRRRELIDICRKYDVKIIEDDVYALSLEQKIPPMASLAPERTFFIASTSEALSGGLRIAYIASPDEYFETIEQSIGYSISMAAPLMAEIARYWIESGIAEQTLWQKKEEAAARNVLTRRILDGFSVETRSTGFYAWLTLPHPWTNAAFTKIAQKHNVLVADCSHFSLQSPPPKDAVRLALGGTEKREDLTRALTVLAQILHSSEYNNLQ